MDRSRLASRLPSRPGRQGVMYRDDDLAAELVGRAPVLHVGQLRERIAGAHVDVQLTGVDPSDELGELAGVAAHEQAVGSDVALGVALRSGRRRDDHPSLRGMLFGLR